MLDTGMILARWLLLFAVLVSVPARAADVAYPLGSRVGLAPPQGMVASREFSGFEDRSRRAALVVVTLPGIAFAELEASASAEPLRKQGVTFESREPFDHPLGKAVLVVGRQEIENQPVRKWIFILSASEVTALVTAQIPDAAREVYSDEIIRTALASVAVRASVPTDEQLGLLPFKVRELAGFNVGGIIAGRAVMLTDGTSDKPSNGVDTHILVAIGAGGPAQASDRERFARELFASVPNLREVRVTSSEPLRIGGQQGHQIMARGRDGASGTEITVVQWLRFSGGAYLHLIGVAKTDGWLEAYGRFRQVRDGIDVR